VQLSGRTAGVGVWVYVVVLCEVAAASAVCAVINAPIINAAAAIAREVLRIRSSSIGVVIRDTMRLCTSCPLGVRIKKLAEELLGGKAAFYFL
jgi:hypothetical protein